MIRFFCISFFVLGATSSFAGGLNDAYSESAAGLRAQSMRMKVIAQNIANADSTGATPGSDPYRRQIIIFKNKYNKDAGTEVVTVDKVKKDTKTPFNAKFDPSSPAADEKGYVLLPNLQTPMEIADMKEAQGSYEANLGAMETTKRMFATTLDLLR